MLDYEFFYIICIPIYIFFLLFLKYRKTNIKKLIFISIFYFYIISLLAVTIFPIPIQWLKEIKDFWDNTNNFVPFASIFGILSNNNLDLFVKVKQILGNIILFIPMGFFIPLIWEKINFKKALIFGVLISFLIEFTQFTISLILWFSYKVTDIDDIILNTLGFIVGFILYKNFYTVYKKY